MRSVFSSIGFGRRRVPIESLYQNSDDSTTSIRAKIFTSNTTDHSSMNRESEKNSSAIVQPPPSKNAMNFSPNATAALNAFQLTLDLLGKTPIPGIGAVTAVLLQVVKSVQEIPQVEAGWKELAERMTRLSFLMRKSAEFKLQEIERYCTPLYEELGKLSEDIEKASKQGKLVNFFTSTDALASLFAHQKTLDSIIIDLTTALCMNTSLTVVELKTHLDEMLSRTSLSDASTIHLAGNSIGDIAGLALSNNQLSRNARITITDNKFGKVHGAMLSQNMLGP